MQHLPEQNQVALTHFLHAIFKRKWVFLEAVVGTVVLNLIALATSLYSMQVYDRVIPNQGLQTLWVLTVGVLVAVGLELVLKQVRAMMVDRACKAIDVELSDFFFERALRIRLDQRPRTIGSFAAQVRMYESVRTFLTSTTLFLLADIPFAFLFVAVIAFIAAPVAVVPLVLLPISIVAGLLFIAPIARLTHLNVAESTLKNGVLIESIDGAETIKTLGAEPAFVKRWHSLVTQIGDGELSLKSLSGFSQNFSQAIQQLSYVGMVVTGVYVITAGELTMGGLIACSIISGRALTPIAQISNLVAQWQHARFSLKGLNEILNKPADDHYEHGVPVEPTRCELDLKLEGVEFAYESQTEVLHVPSLRIQAGERVAIIGAVGSGKSTLLKLMAGLYRPLKGRVFLDGVDMAHLRSTFVRRHVHFLPQDARLFNGTLRENLVLGLAQDPGDDALLKAAKATGLDKMMAQHPRGLGLMISEGGHGLSGGQRQVVAITRLMLSRSGILLLDEPTASLDGPLEEQVARSLLELSVASDSVVIVTHKPSLLKYVNRIVVMDRGRVALDGPRDAVLARLSQPPKQNGGPA